MEGRVLDFVALGILITVVTILVYGVIYIHDIPYKIAKSRNHPHLHAIHTAGWVSLFLMHALWPFLWIWATLYVPEKGFGMSSNTTGQEPVNNKTNDELTHLKERVALLEEKLIAITGNKPQSPTKEA